MCVLVIRFQLFLLDFVHVYHLKSMPNYVRNQERLKDDDHEYLESFNDVHWSLTVPLEVLIYNECYMDNSVCLFDTNWFLRTVSIKYDWNTQKRVHNQIIKKSVNLILSVILFYMIMLILMLFTQ